MKPVSGYPIPVVRLIVPDDAGRVLILQRAHTAYAAGQWCLPGGKVDYGYTVETAARRELQEETGLCSDVFTFLFFLDSLPMNNRDLHCIAFYLECQASGNIQLNPESSRYARVAPSQLEHYSLAYRDGDALRCYWRERKIKIGSKPDA